VNARLALGGTLALSVLALAGFSVVFPRLMYGRLGGEPAELRTLAQAIADGNLAARLDPRLLRQGSVGEALLKMRDALRDSVRTIRLSADQIAAGSAQIARGNDDLATRTEQQASRVQETASAMDQVKGSVAQTADHARSASELATRACDVAQRGGTAVGRMLTTMDDIQASSRKIAEIIGTIDSIAFQTNILALNAAVEAARAGDHGRGFAVVASEVRALAQRSAAAAREIKDLIDASVAKVEAGHVQASDAGTTMREIVEQVQRVTALIGEISAAAAEQNGGIGGINQSVTEIDRTTQSNAALVEQSAASAATLAEQAQALNRSMERFQLAEG
jgi:methyl-accepting chemotaxis protein